MNLNANLVLGDPSAELVMSSVGGSGGRGGDGGNGGHGATGYAGADATRWSSGGNGGPGGNGGDGGGAGNGGNAGDGADSQITLHQCDMDLIMLLKQRVPNTHAGTPGQPGVPGQGGAGGRGGRGGASYSWQEAQTTYGPNGQSQTTYISYTNPGGSPGPNGCSGRNGMSGRAGMTARNGRFNIVLTTHSGGQLVFPSPYNLALLSNRTWVDSVGYGITEPGCITLVTVGHSNTGGMNTPSDQRIWAYLLDNQWVTCPVSNRVALSPFIQAGVSEVLSRPIVFHVTDVTTPAMGPPFRTVGSMDHCALVERVNQDFPAVRAQHDPFTIQFPVEMSIIKGGDAISFQERSPLVFFIENISRLSIGLDGAPARLLHAQVTGSLTTQGGESNLEEADLHMHDCDGVTWGPVSTGVFSDVRVVPAGGRMFFASSIKFTNPATKPYTRVTVTSRLCLGHVRGMLEGKDIQLRPFEVQLAESYVRKEQSQVLIVVNNRTDYEEVEAWKRLCESAGEIPSIWNVNLYGDLNLEFRKKDGRTLFQDFHCSNIVLLNSPFLFEENDKDHYAYKFVRMGELLKASRDHGINVLVFGGAKELKWDRELLPLEDPAKCQVVYSKSVAKLVKGTGKSIAPGEGSAVPTPAIAKADVCGYLKHKGSFYWANLFFHSKTLCLYKSTKKGYPDISLLLQPVKVETLVESECIIANTPMGKFEFGSGEKHTTEKRKKKTGERAGFTTSLEAWAAAFKRLDEESDEWKVSEEDFSGFLCMKTKGFIGSDYKKYFFRTCKSAKCLLYYTSHTAPLEQYRGCVSLGRYRLEQGDFYGKEKSTAEMKFQIMTPSETYFFKADSEEDRVKWVDEILSCSPMAPAVVPVHTEHASERKAKNLFFTRSMEALTRDATRRLSTSKNSVDSAYDSSADTITSLVASQSGSDVDTVCSAPSSPKPSLQRRVSVMGPQRQGSLKHALSLSGSVSTRSSGSRIALSSATTTPSSDDASEAELEEFEREIANMPSMNTVQRIEVESRYIFTSPKEGDLRGKAKSIVKTLAKKFPNQRNVAVYHFEPQKQSRGFCIKHIGHIDVHRSLDRTRAHWVHRNVSTVSDIHSPATITSFPSKFAFVKSLDFTKKIMLLDQEMRGVTAATAPIPTAASIHERAHFSTQSTTLAAAMLAILSDIADEQIAFRSSSFAGGLDVRKLCSRMECLVQLKTFVFGSLHDQASGPEEDVIARCMVLVELVMLISLLASCFKTSFSDFLLPFRRATNMKAATRQSLVEILSAPCIPDCAVEFVRGTNKWKDHMKNAWKTEVCKHSGFGCSNKKGGKGMKVDKKVMLQCFHAPTGISLDTQTQLASVMSKKEYTQMYVAPRPNQVKEDRFLFSSQADEFMAVRGLMGEFDANAGGSEGARERIVKFCNVKPPHAA